MHPTIRATTLATALATTLLATTGLAQAGTADWAHWTSQSGSTVTGTLVSGSDTVGITYSGAAPSFVQLNGSGFNYWQSPATPYQSSVISNAPAWSDIIELNEAGLSTITFSQAVVNPVIGLVSWNGAIVHFGGGTDTQTYNVQYLSSGYGYWGSGSFTSTTADSFVGSGELHGVIELLGTYTSISFTDSVSEGWHGLTVGLVGGAAPTSAVPESGNLALMLAGLGALGLTARRRRA